MNFLKIIYYVFVGLVTIGVISLIADGTVTFYNLLVIAALYLSVFLIENK